MDYIEKYIKRLNSRGFDSKDAYINKSKIITRNKIHTSPSFAVVKINGIYTDSIVNADTKYDEKKIFFMPDTLVNIGSIVEYKDKKYMLMSFVDDKLTPKGDLKLCNETFLLSGKDERIQNGVNEFGQPKWTIIKGETTPLPCIAQATILSDDINEAINMIEGQMLITIPFTEHDDIAEGKDFTMYNAKYKIMGIDYTKSINKVGLLIIKGKRV